MRFSIYRAALTISCFSSAFSAPTALAPFPLAALFAASTAATDELLGRFCSCTVYPVVPAGQSDVNVASVAELLASALPPTEPTVSTCGADVPPFELPALPIRTPTPIARSSRPIPASPVSVADLRLAESSSLPFGEPGGADGADAAGALAACGPASRKLLRGICLSPHSRQ